MKIKENRSLIGFILLNIITLSLYSLFYIHGLAKDLNVMCEGDGKKTRGLLALIILSTITCGIYGIVWWYGIGERLSENAPRYGLKFSENGATVLLWSIFGSLICGIGGLVAFHIVAKNTNALAKAYNANR